MRLLTLLRKELAWSRHRLATIAVLLIVLPAVFGAGTLFFQHTFPENTPVAVVSTGDATGDDIDIVSGALTLFADPVAYESSERAFSDLERERVYAVVEVPGGMGRAGESITIDLHIDGRITPYRVPSRALLSIMSVTLDRQMPADVGVERHVVGAETSLSAYLLPIFLMILVMLLAFTYVPYNVAAERGAIDRLRLDSSIDAVLLAKFSFLTPLVLVAILTIYGVGDLLGYPLQPLSLPLVGSYLLTFLYLSAISVSVMLVTDFSTLGRVLNVVVFFLLVPLSNLAYPAGFFSELGLEIARSLPTHYAMIVARSHMLKGVETGTFAEWWGWLAGVTLGAFLLLKLTIEWYKRE
jgi:ABC-2 type transport system permease protein